MAKMISVDAVLDIIDFEEKWLLNASLHRGTVDIAFDTIKHKVREQAVEVESEEE